MGSETSIGSFNTPRILLIPAITITITILLCSLKSPLSLSFYPQTPIIKVNNVLISNFMVTDSNLAANWLANVTIYNPNIALSIHMKQIQASILYKHNVLSLTSLDDFELDSLEKRDVFVKFVTTGNEGDQPIIEYPLLKEIEKDWGRGKIKFGMRFNAMSKYKTDCLGLRGMSIMMDPYSIDFDVNVEDARRRRGARDEIYDIVGHIPEDGTWLIMVDD